MAEAWIRFIRRNNGTEPSSIGSTLLKRITTTGSGLGIGAIEEKACGMRSRVLKLYRSPSRLWRGCSRAAEHAGLDTDTVLAFACELCPLLGRACIMAKKSGHGATPGLQISRKTIVCKSGSLDVLMTNLEKMRKLQAVWPIERFKAPAMLYRMRRSVTAGKTYFWRRG